MSEGTLPPAFVHASSFVDEGAVVGAGTRIWHFSHVQAGARIGSRCVLGQNVNVDRGAVLGDGVKVQNNVSVYGGVIVEDDAFLGPSAVFTNVVNPRAHVERKSEFRETRVGRGATVGANATVVCGHRIGAYAMVGAGSVVTRDVPPHALVVGVPARRVGWVCRCGEKLAFRAAAAACSRCGDRYALLGPDAVGRVQEPNEREET
ncbi:N-acetyltransferase [Myxococcota bacterium]|nr:N-acetyltransferase [Myxococcota bacterium]